MRRSRAAGSGANRASASRRRAALGESAAARSRARPVVSPTRANSSAASSARGPSSAARKTARAGSLGAAGDEGARRGEAHLEHGVGERGRRGRATARAQLAGGVHGRDAQRRIGRAGGGGQGRRRQRGRARVRQLHDGAQREIAVGTDGERLQSRVEVGGIDAHERAQRRQSNAQRGVGQRGRNVAEGGAIGERAQRRDGLCAYAGVGIVRQRRQESVRVGRMQRGQGRRRAGADVGIGVAGEPSEPRASVGQCGHAVEGGRTRGAVAAVERRA